MGRKRRSTITGEQAARLTEELLALRGEDRDFFDAAILLLVRLVERKATSRLPKN